MANKVLPIVRVFLLCESVKYRAKTSQWVLTSPTHTLSMPVGISEKLVQERLAFYYQLTDAVGTFNLSIQMQLWETGTIITKNDLQKIDFPSDHSAVIEGGIVLSNVPIPRAGVYEFKLLANYAELQGGTTLLRVLAGH